MFVEAWRGWEGFDPRSEALGRRLLVITCQQVATFRLAHDLPSEPDVNDVAGSVLVTDEMNRLGEPTRRIIDLALRDDLTQSRIAQLMDLSEDAVNSHACRGLARLRNVLELNGAGHHGARLTRELARLRSGGPRASR